MAESFFEDNPDEAESEAAAEHAAGEPGDAAEDESADDGGDHDGDRGARVEGRDRAPVAAPPHTPSNAPVAQHVGRLSDRAIQRVVGGNAFLRGRLYARRNAVADLSAEGQNATAKIMVRSQEEPYQVRVDLKESGEINSQCSCPGWRGPTGHCKHVAALLVALRDRERPPRPKQPEQIRQGGPGGGVPVTTVDGSPAGSLHMPQTVSVGGKRRRSRRRRRGAGEPATVTHLEVLSTRELAPAPAHHVHHAHAHSHPHAHELRGPSPDAQRGSLDAWLAADELPRPYELEYRLVVRAASITVTPVLAGTRTAVPIADALAGFNTVSPATRPLLRALARHTTRGTPATAELRGEDAAEVLEMLRDRRSRVLLEPASMELRFSDEALKPKIELDLAHSNAVRVRVVFELKNGLRRFPLSTGAWFEGTPGWHIDTGDGTARPVAEQVTPAWLQRLYRSPALVHPAQDLPRLLTEFVPRVAASLGAELPDLANVADVVDASPQFQLRAKGDIVEARVRLRAVYQGTELEIPVRGFPSPLAFLPPGRDGGRPRVVRRDVGAEMSAVQDVMNLGLVIDEEGQQELVARGDTAINFWTEGIGTLPEEWDRFIPDDLVDVTIRNTPVVPQMRVASGVDWLSLDLTFDSGGVAVSEDELRMCLEKGRRLVKLADGTYAPVQAEQVAEVLERMAEIVATSGSRKKLPLSQAGRIQELLKIVSSHHQLVGKEVRELFGKLQDVGEIEQVAKPRNLKGELRPYQKRGFSWLVFLHNLATGGILADDMGLGKTLQAIALLCWVKAQEKKGKKGLSLVVAPTSVVPNWQREIEKFAPSLRTVVWHGPDRHEQKAELEDADVMITSYALMRRDEEFLHTLDLKYAILDEAQHIKNPLSATARAAKKLKSERRLAMTGTPIENRLSEIWSIMDYVSPGLLGDLRTFEEKFARPIDRGDLETAGRLRATIHPFVLRREKTEVAKDLPEKIKQEIVVPLAEEQSKLYKQILREVRAALMSEVEKQGVAKTQIQILAALTRLRQVACDPRLINLPGEWDHDESGKLSALREIVSEASAGGHRVLIFSQFVTMLQLIKSALDEDGVKYEYLDGSTKDRQERVDRFNTDESYNAFLISLKAGGTGLNLTGADTVIHFDPWWNPAVEDQATDRAHRIGQSKVVTVYKLIAKGTVEEKILQLSEKKRELVSNVLTTEGTPMKGLTKQDVDELFSD